jgi:hypothetical protein
MPACPIYPVPRLTYLCNQLSRPNPGVRWHSGWSVCRLAGRLLEVSFHYPAYAGSRYFAPIPNMRSPITDIWTASRIVLRKYNYHKSVELEDSSSTQKLSSDNTLQQSLALKWGERVEIHCDSSSNQTVGEYNTLSIRARCSLAVSDAFTISTYSTIFSNTIISSRTISSSW